MARLYYFRFDVYTGEGYVNPEDYPNKSFSDQFDPYSSSVLGLKNDRIIGCQRATHYSALGLPVQQFLLSIFRRKQTCLRSLKWGVLWLIHSVGVKPGSRHWVCPCN